MSFICFFFLYPKVSRLHFLYCTSLFFSCTISHRSFLTGTYRPILFLFTSAWPIARLHDNLTSPLFLCHLIAPTVASLFKVCLLHKPCSLLKAADSHCISSNVLCLILYLCSAAVDKNSQPSFQKKKKPLNLILLPPPFLLFSNYTSFSPFYKRVLEFRSRPSFLSLCSSNWMITHTQTVLTIPSMPNSLKSRSPASSLL